MEAIKFKKSDAILVAIAIVLIIAFVIVAIKASKREEENEAKRQEKEKKNSLTKLIERWEKLAEQISIEIKSLKLTQEMEAMLERKINRYVTFTKISFCIVFTFLVGFFFSTGTDMATALLNATGILGVLFFGSSLLIANKFAEPNAVIQSFVEWVRKSIYKKYGYDPALIPAIQESIELKQGEAKIVQEHINSMYND
jgi:ABC-type multidrug transport system fused ATPase/permease subunit